MTQLRLTLVTALLVLAACQKPPLNPEPAPAKPAEPVRQGHLLDFGEPNLPRLIERLQHQQAVHIVQLGDSHTAADFFTGALRYALQQDYGDAGPGLLPPAHIRGQRSAALNPAPAGSGWQLSSSRLATAPGDWPLGGFMLTPQPGTSTLRLSDYQQQRSRLNLRSLYRSRQPATLVFNGQPQILPASGDWQWSAPVSIKLPVQIEREQTQPQPDGPELGGWLLDNGQPGIMLSALGVNGATARISQRWDPQWHQQLQALQPGLLMLAYGTNEAYDDQLDPAAYRQQLLTLIRQLRRHNPHAVLLLVGPPDVIRHPLAASCQQRQPARLQAVRQLQMEIARQQKTLFWDWQGFMGGPCAMEHWQADELARRDGVHLTRQGYERSALGLYQDLRPLLQAAP